MSPTMYPYRTELKFLDSNPGLRVRGKGCGQPRKVMHEQRGLIGTTAGQMQKHQMGGLR